jgi:transposase
VETIGTWYWLVDEVGAAGMVSQVVHGRKAKPKSGMVNKTDKLDVRSLNRLQRTGTLPTVWIPSELRDQRDLPRTRMVLTRERTRSTLPAGPAAGPLKVDAPTWALA